MPALRSSLDTESQDFTGNVAFHRALVEELDARLARAAGGPVYALGGVNDKTARRLLPAGLVGLAAIEALRT